MDEIEFGKYLEQVFREGASRPRWTYTDAASRSAFIDFSQYDRRPMCFDSQGNMRPCDEDVIETTGRVVDEDDPPKENAIVPR